MVALGIDPGQKGAFAAICDSVEGVEFSVMPLNPEKEIDFDLAFQELKAFQQKYSVDGLHVFLERALPMAMGSKAAFNYGRGFAALEIAIKLSGIPVTYVEPAKWAKEMCEGIDTNLKAKARSLIAFHRLFPWAMDKVPKSPKSKKLHDGVIEAMLIAQYGLRKHGSGR